jgi:hypothetical protein
MTKPILTEDEYQLAAQACKQIGQDLLSASLSTTRRAAEKTALTEHANEWFKLAKKIQDALDEPA